MRPIDEREKVLNMHFIEKKSAEKIRAEVGIPLGTVKVWINRYKKRAWHQSAGLEGWCGIFGIRADKNRKEVQNPGKDSRADNGTAHKPAWNGGWTAAKFSVREGKKADKRAIFSVIKRFSEKYSVSAMCSFYNVSRSGYYSWLRRPETSPGDTRLLKMIEECQAKHKRRYGYRRVTAWLKSEKGLTVNDVV